MELPKRYDPKEAEQKWQKYWADNDIYTYHPDERETYSVDTPPPTVSGAMHLGHAFSYTQQDIVVRYQRMKGKNVFFPFGTDDNGLPTGKLVEKKKKVLSRNMSREDFVHLCNEVIEETKPLFIKSWKEIGMSADFKRSYSTINEHSQITSQASFIDLFKKERIGQKESPVAWCVSCQTAIAQAEFESIEKGSHFNDIKFTSGDEDLIISTTRPELVPACVALFYHPEDDRYKHLEGKKATVPVFNYEVPIIADKSVDKEKGTGLMMVCTFGDKEDVEKWHKHNLGLRVVFEKWGKMNDLAGEFKGLKIKDGRKAILAKLEETGALVNQKEITHATNVHERCKTPIEFMKTKQWYIKILDKKKELLEAGNKITWYPEHMKVRYDHWVENLNWDWCISRQRHFGIPIPVWQCQKCQEFVVPELDELPIDPTTAKTKNACKCGSSELIGETDVLDTWATSSVTPEIARNWVHKGEYDIEYVDAPMDLRPQAHDIIRTWLFYTLAKSYFHFDRIPWKNVAISGHAQDSAGRKMSKSMGNGIDPMAMIEKYSADALRFWAATSKLGDDLPFQEKDLLTGQKTATKIFNASKFSLMHLEDYKESQVSEVFDQWLLSKLQKVIKSATESFEKYEYSKVKSEVDIFFWQSFCDQYLEIVKDRLYKPELRGIEQRKSGQQALFVTLRDILKMIAPIMPHITEEVYQLYFKDKEGKESIHTSEWPSFNESLVNENAEIAGDLGVDIINSIRKYKSENQVSMKEELSRIILVSDEANFKEMVLSIQDDLKAVLHVKEIAFEGETSLNSERFGINIGVVN
ncbi:valine--tRNA ligase [Candidatus Woesearchaeota archaeon]|nr:valine--tRNA ligase [Candidatus Woesearchaeota archaeon]MBT4150943.1 valine--tRNA ligase [Candidatus Woesearchaeota archaeon]MBT4433733.1 valine--tRNA ligase [Candidatus Woesearchaeota archaeon]MBT7332258.1 valine--tRNA ligase [Candidatus Woesearchaeota archaeon]